MWATAGCLGRAFPGLAPQVCSGSQRAISDPHFAVRPSPVLGMTGRIEERHFAARRARRISQSLLRARVVGVAG